MNYSDLAAPKLPHSALFLFDGKGGATAGDLQEWPADKAVNKPPTFSWVHLHRDAEETKSWLAAHGPDRFVVEALTEDETRPRCTIHGEGALLNLRGVNLNPGAEPEDMVSVRLWIEKSRVIGVWLRPLSAVRDMFDAIERKQAPRSPGDLVAKLALRLADRAEPVIAALNERLDALEESLLNEAVEFNRTQLAEIRRSAIVLRRYMFPQRDALWTLETEELDWISERDRSRIREAAERVTRLAEELDAIRDRAQIVHDQIADLRAETLNKHMLLLSVVAAIFLPLGLLTGLLGINVGGIPGAESQWSFFIVCAAIAGIAAGEVMLFKRLGLLR